MSRKKPQVRRPSRAREGKMKRITGSTTSSTTMTGRRSKAHKDRAAMHTAERIRTFMRALCRSPCAGGLPISIWLVEEAATLSMEVWTDNLSGLCQTMLEVIPYSQLTGTTCRSFQIRQGPRRWIFPRHLCSDPRPSVIGECSSCVRNRSGSRRSPSSLSNVPPARIGISQVLPL